MAFTYTADLTNSLDFLRFRLNDKIEEYAVYQDEELNYFINKIDGTPTEIDLNKIALKLLKQQLQEIMRGPSRERAGKYEVYAATSQSLKAAIAEIESEIDRTINVPSMYAGGVYKSDVCANRSNETLTQTVFDRDEFFDKECVNDRDSGFIGGN